MSTFLVPVERLQVAAEWEIGAVTFVPLSRAREVAQDMPRLTDLDTSLDDFVEHLEVACALVESESISSALDLVRTAVDVLRTYQQATSPAQTTMFGLSGEVARGQLSYVKSDQHSGAGWMNVGSHLGWTFDTASIASFTGSEAWSFLAGAVGESRPSAGEARALLSVQLASQAVLEHRPGMRLVTVMMSLEALLLERSTHAQSLLLARRILFLTCKDSAGQRCGLEKPTCPFVGADVHSKSARAELKALRDLSNVDYRWRCSAWHHVVDRYDLRSEVVHGGSQDVSEKDASTALFWLLHEVLPSTLDWLRRHSADPLVDLDEALGSLPDAPDCAAIIGNS